MPLLPKCMLFVFFLFCFGQTKAQLFKPRNSRSSHHLIATNEKKTRRYVDDDVLKIWYHNNGNIIKAKGRLLIDSAGVVELLPYRRKPFAVINTDSIVSISRWHRKEKIGLAVNLGVGLAIATIGLLATPRTAGVADDYSFLFLIIAGVDAYYLAIATPIVFISEWLSLRSEKKGYHFYVE